MLLVPDAALRPWKLDKMNGKNRLAEFNPEIYIRSCRCDGVNSFLAYRSALFLYFVSGADVKELEYSLVFVE